jgi:hypothetical protein
MAAPFDVNRVPTKCVRLEGGSNPDGPSASSFAKQVPARISVKVFLLPFDPKRPVFYSEDEVDGAEEPEFSPGLVGRIERIVHRVKSSLKHPRGRLARKTKQVWDWLQLRMHPDEPLLASLRTARTIEIHHPTTLTNDAVRDLWSAYLKRRRLRHRLWLSFDALFAPVSVLLTPLPGPNVIGYWFAYRVVHHLLILIGIRRAMRGPTETLFRPDDGLDASASPGDREWLDRTATRYELNHLHDYVARVATGPSALSAAEVTRGTQPSCDC